MYLPILGEGCLKDKTTNLVLSFESRLPLLQLLRGEVGHHMGDLDIGMVHVQGCSVNLRGESTQHSQRLYPSVVDDLKHIKTGSNKVLLPY